MLAEPAIMTSEIIDPKTPLVTARFIFSEYRTADGDETIRFYLGRFYRWDGARSAWQEMEDEAMRKLIYRWLETKKVIVRRGENEFEEPFGPNKSKVDVVIDAMRAEGFMSQRITAPCWLDGRADRPATQSLLVAKNGLVHLPAFVSGQDYFTEPTPLFFNVNALDFDFLPQAPMPVEWISFLTSLWPDDSQSVSLLQEWFGYCLTNDTRLQKMLLLYGPKRSGKGTIGRILKALLGHFNVAGPTLGSLAGNFGMWSLIGKTLAIISDARLSGRTDQSVITERLLAISGEDTLTIDRKNLVPLTLRLTARVMVLTNELPRLSDASGALASRFLILRLTRSFYDAEDIELEGRLMPELPGILLWAIEGWKRLQGKGQFTIPASSADAVQELDELGSPITSFVREQCEVSTGSSVDVDDLFKAWKTWCEGQGRDHPGTKQSFGRDLSAAFPALRVTQPRVGGERIRRYEGIGVR
jgi:putative DNA primase/helicase